jgi:Zn ribbon nucleic-acid-binding protein
MPKPPKPADAILTVAARMPKICPACAKPDISRAYESAGITRVTCGACNWTERYRVTDAV